MTLIEAHVLQGLLVALKRIDEVVQIIRTSRNRETAAKKLEKELKLSERQSVAIARAIANGQAFVFPNELNAF